MFGSKKKKNKYFTLLIVPEKTSEVRRVVIPSWLLQSVAVGIAFCILVAGVMVFDYWYVMSQIGENKQLRLENRKLRQQVQVFQNKMTTVENTLDRVKSFATRLKVIMHVEEHPNHRLEGKALPDANANITRTLSTERDPATLPKNSRLARLLDAPTTFDPEKVELRREYHLLEGRLDDLGTQALQAEELLQDHYEILHDKKDFLAALPTQQPAAGYFTSGFGVRQSPFGNRVKMHEGLDIANRLGTFVRATADGEVEFASSKPGYGMTVVIKHGYGLETWYGHLKKFIVSKGDKVRRGTKIALLGNSGRSTGPHVHYEVRVNGYPVDPLSYIIEDPIP